MCGENIGDEELQHLKGVINLQSLDLRWAPITDAGLHHLSGMSSLQTLDLGRSKVTDGGLQYLSGLFNLRKIYLIWDFYGAIHDGKKNYSIFCHSSRSSAL
jgi:hypothetical protein